MMNAAGALMEGSLASGSRAGLQTLDDPQEWAAFSQSSSQGAGSVESGIQIEGMYCAACALKIEEALSQLPGVERVQIDAGRHRARVTWWPDRVQPSGWMGVIEALGYRALPANDSQVQQLRRAETRTMLWRWLVAGLCMMQVMMYATPAYVARPGEMSADMLQLLRWASWVLTLPVLLFSARPFFANAWRDLRGRRISMDLPVALGILVAFGLSSIGTFEPDGIWGREVYFDSLTMFVFFLLTGRWLELRLRDRTMGALDALLNRLPEQVQRRLGDGSAGSYQMVTLRQLRVGDVLRILPGQAFPVDGELLSGQTWVDEALLTGESTALPRSPGQKVIAGSHNLQAAVEIRADRVGAETRYGQIVAMMEEAALVKPESARQVDRWARPFLIGVLLAAAGAAVYGWADDPAHALMVAVSVLVVTCPCALSLATPSALLAAASYLARRGVQLRRLGALESLAQVDHVVFDKTGTLTHETLTVQTIQTRAGVAPEQALAWASLLAAQSLHPVSRALVAAARESAPSEPLTVLEVQELPGQGLEARLALDRLPSQMPIQLRLGSAVFCDVPADQLGSAHQGPMVFLADEQGWLARFELGEHVRADAPMAIQALQQQAVALTLASGDKPGAVETVAAQLGISHWLAECTPQAKLNGLQSLQHQGHHVAMVGDGLNDGPVLAAAHVSFAFGPAVALNRARADVVVLGQQLMAVPQTLVLAQRTMRIVRQNMAWSVAYNAVCVPLAMFGWLPAWLAGLGMALSSLLVVLNSTRLARGASIPT